MAQARQAEDVADGETRNAERTAANTEPRLGWVRQQQGQTREGAGRQRQSQA
jgi:hypothetical protein